MQTEYEFQNIRNVRIEVDSPRKYIVDVDIRPLGAAEGTPWETVPYCADGVDQHGICPAVFAAIEAMPDKSTFVSEADWRSQREAAWEARPYTVKRVAEYPAIGDQLDALWHAMDDGVLPKVEPFYGDIAAVKAAHPKPAEG